MWRRVFDIDVQHMISTELFISVYFLLLFSLQCAVVFYFRKAIFAKITTIRQLIIIMSLVIFPTEILSLIQEIWLLNKIENGQTYQISGKIDSISFIDSLGVTIYAVNGKQYEYNSHDVFLSENFCIKYGVCKGDLVRIYYVDGSIFRLEKKINHL